MRVLVSSKYEWECFYRGGSRIFMGGGRAKCANAHYERETRSPFRHGSRAGLRALEALGVFLMVSRDIWALISDTKCVFKNHSRSNFRGTPIAAPWIRHCIMPHLNADSRLKASRLNGVNAAPRRHPGCLHGIPGCLKEAFFNNQN